MELIKHDVVLHGQLGLSVFHNLSLKCNFVLKPLGQLVSLTGVSAEQDICLTVITTVANGYA